MNDKNPTIISPEYLDSENTVSTSDTVTSKGVEELLPSESMPFTQAIKEEYRGNDISTESKTKQYGLSKPTKRVIRATIKK